jgi:K+-sensing histidine kinase KdpD
VVRVDATDVASGIAQVARARGATHVVIPHDEVGRLRRLTQRPLVDQLLERLPQVEVHTVGPVAPEGRRS